MYSIVIENGRVVFGDDKPSEILNIGIIGDKIAKISKEKLEGKKIIDAKGQIVSPGFIDPHCHSDIIPFFKGKFISKLHQGVTTEINGNCGIGVVPLNDKYREEGIQYIRDHIFLLENEEEIFNLKTTKNLISAVNEKGAIVNQAYLLATGCLRVDTVGFSNQPLSEEDRDIMLRELDKQLSEGAYGISFGLVYQPGNFINTEEIKDILKVVAKHDKIAAFHMRNEGERVIESVKEVVECALETGCKINLSHLKVMDKRLWGKSKEILELITEAREKGAYIVYDQYPYVASSTNLMVLIPARIFDGDIHKFMKTIDTLTPQDKKEIEGILEKRGGASNVLIAKSFLENDIHSGKTLEEISKILNLSNVDTALYLIKESIGRTRAIYFTMDEKDMLYLMKNSIGAIGSDGNSIPVEFDERFGIPHPRNFNTFPRFLKLNKENNLFSIEEMIRKITFNVAESFKIKNRGKIEEGYFADITIFDYENIVDNSNFEKPYAKPLGINYVVVNGVLALDNGVYQETRSGRGI